MSDLAAAPGFAVSYADLVGKPFRLGGRGPDAFDCYGLVMELGRRAGVELPDHRSPDELRKAGQVVAASLPQWTPCEPGPGAVACIRMVGYVSHVGLVLPFDKLIHVWERSGGVCVERLSDWQRRVAGYYRFV